MTFWAKLLTVVVFVLSLIFASMSAVVFGKREDYRAQLKAVSDKYEAEKADWTQKNTVLNDKFNQKFLELQEVTTNYNTARNDVTRLTDDVKRMDAERQAMAITNQKEQDLNLELVADMAKQTQEREALLADRTTLKNDNDRLTKDLSAAQTSVNELEKKNTELDASLKSASADLAKAKETIALNDEIFTELGKQNVDYLSIINRFTTLPDIRSKVLLADPGSNFVILNVGKKQGVMNNYTFSIFRDGAFVAKVSVFNVQEEMCAARIVVPKLAVQKGDNAWTRLMSD